MWPVSETLLRTIRGPHRVASMLEYTNGNELWSPLTVSGGKVTADRTSQTRWSLDATVSADGADEVSPFGSMLRARRGVYLPDGNVEWVPLGVYRCESVQRDVSSPTVKITGLSSEKIVQDEGFLIPRSLHGGSAVEAIRELITEVIPGVYVDVRVDDQTLGSLTEDQDRWAMIDGNADSPSVAKLLGAEVYCDAIGRFVIAPTPTVADRPVWTADSGVLVKASSTQSRNGVVNLWVVTGASVGEGEAAGPGYAWDRDPNSPTFAGTDLFDPDDVGPFGRVIDYYTSSALKTTGDCQRVAYSKLADSLGLAAQVSFTSVVNPALRPGDVVRVAPPGQLASNHVLDSVEIDLGAAATMTTKTRTTRSVNP